MSEDNERKIGAFKWEGTTYHQYEENGDLDHEYFIDVIKYRIGRIIGSSAIGSYAKQHDNVFISKETKLDGTTNVIPDYYFYEHGHFLIIGEAKATRDDLNSIHTDEQIKRYYQQLRTLNREDNDAKMYLIMGIPFMLAGEIRRRIRKVTRGLINDKNDISQKFINNVNVIYATEIDGKNIEIPYDFDVNKELYPNNSYRYETVLNNHTYPSYISHMNIDDICYDEQNTRLASPSVNDSLSQEECERRLLLEDEVNTIPLRRQSVIRRQSMLTAGAVYNPLEVFEHKDGKGNLVYTVVDGNSRLALSHDIVNRSNSALAYHTVPVEIYKESDGINKETIKMIKERAQHDPKVGHSNASVASQMYKERQSGRTIDDIFIKYNREYGKQLIDNSINTIDVLFSLGYKDITRLNEVYSAAYDIVAAFKVTNKYNTFSEFNRDNAVKSIIRDYGTPKGFAQNHDHLKNALQSRGERTDAQKKVLLKWLHGGYQSDEMFNAAWVSATQDETKLIQTRLHEISKQKDIIDTVYNELYSMNSRTGGIAGMKLKNKDIESLAEDTRLISEKAENISLMLKRVIREIND